MSDILILIAAFSGGFFASWVIGANNASSFGPPVSAGAASVFRGSLLVGLAAFLGAIVQGGSVASTMGKGVVSGTGFSPLVSAIILLTASSFIIAGILMTYPIPAVFTLVGSVVGAGLASGSSINFETLKLIAGFWLIIPFVAVFIGFFSAKLMRKFLKKNERNTKIIQMFLLVLGVFTAYTAGANRVGLAVGPLMNVADIDLVFLLIFGGVGMVTGAWTGSPRVIEAVSRDYSQLGPRRSVSSLLSASFLAQVATILGVPISFNEAVISAVIGAGLAGDEEKIVGKRKIVWTIAAWTGALIVSTLLTYGITSLLVF